MRARGGEWNKVRDVAGTIGVGAYEVMCAFVALNLNSRMH